MNNDPLSNNDRTNKFSRSSKVQSSSASVLLKPLRKTRWRWLALVLMNLLLLGDFVSIESPQPIETQIEQILGIDDHEYSLLYTAFAIPSIIIPFIGGYLIDRLGVRPALFTFSAATALGQILYAFGGYIESFGWMLAGRAVYAVGGDPLNVAQVIITNKWFRGKEVAFAMSLSAMMLGVGRTLNSYIVPKLYDVAQNLFVPMSFSTIISIFSMICAILLIFLDRENDKRETISEERLKQLAEEEKINLRDIKYFKFIVWLLIMSVGFTCGLSLSATAFTNDMYHVQYGFTNSAAGNIISIGFIVAAVSSAILGKVIDSYGYKASMLLYSSFVGLFGFIYFLIVPECDQCLSTVVPQVLFGLYTGSNEAAAYPALPEVLEERFLGTGYGLFFLVQNTVMLVLPIIGALIKEHTSAYNGYFGMFIFFTAIACVTVVQSVAIFVIDRRNGKVLEKKVMEQEDEDDDILRGSVVSDISRPVMKE